jgi:hypothetical protein
VSINFSELNINQSQNGMVTWNIQNVATSTPTNPKSVILETLYIRWPYSAPKLHLNGVKMNGYSIWNSNYEDKVCPAGTICASLPAPSWSGFPSDRTIGANSSANLDVLFSRQLETGEYYLEAKFADLYSGVECPLITISGQYSTQSGP